MKRLSAIILAIALAVSVMAEPLSAVWMLTGNLRSGIAPIASTDSADTMTVVVTHWHASEPKGRPVSESDSSREKAAETLVAQFKHNNVNDTYTLEGADGGDPDSCMKYDGEDTANISSFFVSPKAYHAEGDETEVYEKFAGFSVTTGNDATSSDGADRLKVTYNDSIRLVKIDVLYEYAEPIVAGTPDSTVFADPSSVGDEANKKDPERDISYVYAYPEGSKATDKADLEVDLSGSPILIDGKPLKVDEDGENTNRQKAIEAANSNDEYTLNTPISEVDTVKVYSVEEGLHTDKTATITENPKFNDDGRTFDLQLEAWYSGDNKAKVGLVLDSSGSMAFTSAKPSEETNAEFKRIQVNEGEINSLGITKVPAPTKKEDAFNGDEWFIDDADLDKILDTRKTDNSPNGYNGYSYYIYDSRSDTKEFAPIGYLSKETKSKEITPTVTNSYFSDDFPRAANLLGYYPFDKDGHTSNERDWVLNIVDSQNAYGAKYEKNAFTKTELDFKTNAWYTNDFNFDTDRGFNVSYKKPKNTNDTLDQGILLNAKPDSDYYTVSFSLIQHKVFNSPSTNPNIDEILYIGGLDLNDKGQYLHIYRDGGENNEYIRADIVNNGDSSAATQVYSGNDISQIKAEKQYYTLTFESRDNGVDVTVYVNGVAVGKPTHVEGTIDSNIILGGFKDEYNGEDIFIDDIYVFDGALTSTEVKTLYDDFKSPAKGETPWLDPPDGKKTLKLFYSDSDDSQVAATVDNDGGLGWYCVSSTSSYYLNLKDEQVGTAKEYRSMRWGKGSEEYINYNYAPVDDDNKFGLSSGEVESTAKNYYTYTMEKNNFSPLKFFVDENGYLCCFYNSGSSEKSQPDRYGWSYVYEKDDTSQTKVEVLQRALGLFATGLQETSPTSTIAATKFSTPNINVSDYNQLVLLDWTDSPDEAAQVLSTSRNKEGNEYLYQMTGGTNTYTGLQSFIDNLAGTGANVNKKYLIIFTDGKDTELGNIVKAWKASTKNDTVDINTLKSLIMQTRSYRLAEQIRDMGYTIYAIMLSGGSISSKLSPEDYRQAVNFLAMLTGEETIDDEKDPVTVGTENPTKKDYYLNVYEGSDAGSLITIFSKNIVDIISDDLSEYSVKDYLDPRFDLVDADNNVWKLNDEGKVLVNGTDKTLPADITLSTDRESDGQDAVLNYDAGKHLYYLTWEDVTVPGCNSETVSLPVWNATVTVHAKEDFIGGNYVLTNGNMQLENYVLKQGSEEVSSSGTDKAKRNDDELEGEIIKDPSKGFPRTTVNVQIPDITIEGGAQVIYMGEELTSDGVAEKLGETIYDNWEVSKDRSQWYWEYLARLATKQGDTEKNGTKFKEIITNIVNSSPQTYQYRYIPTSDETKANGETGDEKHEDDKLGELEFVWKNATNGNEYPAGGVTKDTLDRASALTVTYTPSTTDKRKESKDIDNLQSGDANYKWNDDFKPAPGSVFKPKPTGEVKESVTATGSYVTKIVSGQTAFDLKIPADVADYLSEHYSGYTLTYTATLKREYQARSESDGTYKTQTDSVGTYTATYNIPDSETKSSVDPIVCKGIINYLGEYGAPDYVSAYGLPLGVYSFTDANLTVTDDADKPVTNIGVKCGNIEIGDITDIDATRLGYDSTNTKTAEELLNEAKEEISKTATSDIIAFAAKTDKDKKLIYIGQKDNYNTDTSYLDNRYGYGYGTLALDTGSLSINKTVEGLATGEANPDTYTIKLSGDPDVLKGEYPLTGINYGKYVTFINGEAEYTLEGGKSVTIDKLPLGAEIKIDEDVDGKVYTYTKLVPSDDVTIITNTLVTVTNTVKTGSLTISKDVTGPVSTGHEGDKFKFTINLYQPTLEENSTTLTPLTGEYSYSGSDSGKIKSGGTVELAAGQSITIEGLPVGTEFTVVETKDDNYTTMISDDSGDDKTDGKGTIAENSNVTVTFTNAFITGQLSITKTVENGFSTDENKEFSFGVGFDYTGDVNYSIDGGTSTPLDDSGIIKLTPGQTAVFDGLPVGTEFTVEEIDTPACYDVSATVGEDKVAENEGKIIANGKIKATTDNIAVAFVNTRKTGSVTIEKKLTAAEETTLIDKDNNTPFTFTVNLYESDGETPINGTYTTSSGSVTFAEGECEITLKSGESITISGLPVDAKVKVSETAKDGFEEVGVQTADVNAEGTAKLTFNNVKKAPTESEPVTISAIKNLDDKPSEVQFSFKVEKPNGTSETVTNDTKGNIEILKDVTFDEVGEYVYTVSENELSGDDAKKYIKDSSVYKITVNVAEEYVNGVYTGKLVATTKIERTVNSDDSKPDTPVDVGKNGIIFNNKAKTYSLTVNKEVVLNGRTDIDDSTEYGFEVKFTGIDDVSKLSLTIDETPQTPQSGNSVKFSLKKDGKAVISNIPYGAHYEISEDKSDDYSMSSEDDLSGDINSDKEVTVKNTYSLKVAAINAIKTLDGGTLAAEQFKFEVTENGVTKTVFNDGDGKIELIPEKTYAEEESHIYTVREVVDESDPKIKYDKSEYEITVNVTKIGDELKATTEIKRTEDSEGNKLDEPVDAIVFNNSVVTCSLTVNKEVVLNDRTDIDDGTEYGFEVKFTGIDDVSKLSLTIDETPQTQQSGNSITFNLKKDGKAVISNIPYGAHYEISEDKSDDYSMSSEGNLSGDINSDKEVTVKNTYSLKVAAINATKTLDGGTLAAGQFKFEVTENGVTKAVVPNKEDGSIELIPEKTYTEEESHVYTVKEVVDESDPTIKYDKSEYVITVNVTKNAAGELVATAEIKRTVNSEGKTLDEPEVVTEITFNNSVIKPATVTAINATKKLSGATLTAGQFKFEIADENGAKTTVTNKEDGSIELIPEKTFAEEESHVYTVREVVDESDTKIKYDKSVYEITVNVTKNAAGELEATTEIRRTADSEGNKLDTPVPVTDITFENTSVKEEEQPPEPEIELGSITIRKIVGGSQGDKTLPFEFTLSFENLPIGFDTSTLDISGGRDVKQNGAVITFKLADSEELTVKDIPLGTTYLVVETPVDGYGTTAGGVTGNSSRGPISEQKKNITVEFKNTNPIQEAPLLGGFTVKKTVISDDPDDLETPFEFSIQLDPMPAEPDVSTAYTVSGNVITVHLADGEIAKISSLPYGTSFIVNEAQTSGFESRLSETSVASGKISAEQNDFEIEYVNTRTAPPIVEKEEFGNLTIVKFVSGNGFTEGQQFNFTVQLGSDKLYAYTGTGIGPAGGYIKNGDVITLTKNTYIKIHNIPYGTAYSVMEAEADANTVITDGNGIITDGSGIISETNRDAVAQFSNSRFIAPTVPSDPTNPDEPTKLMLTKYVRHTDGTEPDPLAAFTFTVAFASPDPLVPFDFSLNCTVEGQLTSWIDANTLSVTLHHGESVMVSGMPVGTTYAITEAPVEGYSSKFITGNETGILGAAGQSVSVVAENTKSTPVFPAPDSSPTGSLTITKEVKSGDKSKPFTFIAEFTPMTPVDLSTVCTLGGNYTSAEWNGNILTVQLTDGQAILIDVIPYGTSYNVYESGSESYRVTPSEEVGTVSSETPNNVASFSNSRLVGSLSVSKTVSLGSKSKPFTFSIVFTPTEQISLRGICRISGSYTSAVWNENVLTLKLTDGQNAIINGIPSNTAYSIVESDNEGYEVSSVNSEGTIIADTQIKASFTNTLECGSLTVKKIVGLGNKQQPFTFTVSFTPNSSGIVLSSFTVISGDYTSAVWNGDILTLMLADGQNATISNIPYGTAYSVVETPVPLYTSTPDEYASGVISAETPAISTVVVNVQNYNPPSGPIPDNRPVQPPVVDDGPDTDDIVVIPATESGEGEGDEVAEDNETSEESNPKTGLALGLGAISAALTALVISKRR